MRRGSTVDVVSKDWTAEMGKMNAKLMCPSRQRKSLDQSEVIGPFQYAEVCYSRLGIGGVFGADLAHNDAFRRSV